MKGWVLKTREKKKRRKEQERRREERREEPLAGAVLLTTSKPIRLELGVPLTPPSREPPPVKLTLARKAKKAPHRSCGESRSSHIPNLRPGSTDHLWLNLQKIRHRSPKFAGAPPKKTDYWTHFASVRVCSLFVSRSRVVASDLIKSMTVSTDPSATKNCCRY